MVTPGNTIRGRRKPGCQIVTSDVIGFFLWSTVCNGLHAQHLIDWLMCPSIDGWLARTRSTILYRKLQEPCITNQLTSSSDSFVCCCTLFQSAPWKCCNNCCAKCVQSMSAHYAALEDIKKKAFSAIPMSKGILPGNGKELLNVPADWCNK